MNEWKNGLNHVSFEGKDYVLAQVNPAKNSRLSLFLNYELHIPTASLIACVAAFCILIGAKTHYYTPIELAYNIRVINERGEYEKTY